MSAVADTASLHPRTGKSTSIVPRPFLSIGVLRAFALIATAIGVLAALRAYLARGSLWEDELIAVTHANEPLARFLVEILRNDIHPPIYFLQLDGWLALGGHGDRWALANSLAWGAISLLVMFQVARKWHGERAAWFAVALAAVLPMFAWSASTLRMYSAIPACAIAAYSVNRSWFETRRVRWLAACLVVEVVLAYVHAIEFFFVSFIVFGTLVETLIRRDRPGAVRRLRSLGPWLLVQALFCLTFLPLVASGLVRGSDASAPGTALDALMIGGSLVAGWKTSGIASVKLVGLLIFVVLVVAGLASRDSRSRTIAIPIAALIVATAVGVLVKPIFKQPVFAANLLPFVVLGAAVGAARGRAAAIAVSACIVVMTVAVIPLASLQRQGEAYEPAARSVRDRAVAGDVVIVPNVSVSWGILRYAVGPEWGAPLAVLPPPNAEWSRLNGRIEQWFGAGAPRRLGLVPDRDFVDAAGVRYIIGSDQVPATEHAAHVWVVTRDRYAVDVHIDPELVESTVVAPEHFGNGELLVRRFDRPAATGAGAAPS